MMFVRSGVVIVVLAALFTADACGRAQHTESTAADRCVQDVLPVLDGVIENFNDIEGLRPVYKEAAGLGNTTPEFHVFNVLDDELKLEASRHGKRAARATARTRAAEECKAAVA